MTATHNWDHPHACGDKRTNRGCVPRGQGSSPCVWGQGPRLSEEQQADRIIPMRVGTRLKRYVVHRKRWDHPHACGDKWYLMPISIIRQGSSPCVWGQAFRSYVLTVVTGIIPMRVGTSILIFASSVSARDHPHACGDKSITVADIVP